MTDGCALDMSAGKSATEQADLANKEMVDEALLEVLAFRYVWRLLTGVLVAALVLLAWWLW